MEKKNYLTEDCLFDHKYMERVWHKCEPKIHGSIDVAPGIHLM